MSLYKIEKLVAKSSHSGIRNIALNPSPALQCRSVYASASLTLTSAFLASVTSRALSLVPDKVGWGRGGRVMFLSWPFKCLLVDR